MNATEKAPFTPTAVLITPEAEWKDSGGTHVDPTLAVPLHLDSNDNSGWLFTREEWENDQKPRIYRRYGKHEGLEEGERVELLPDLWVVKIDETEHWLDTFILERVKRIFGVYVFDRRQEFHLCSVEPSYELYFLGSQWEPSRELDETEDEDLAERIREGDSQCDEVSYFGAWDVKAMLKAGTFQEGCLPTGATGAGKVNQVKSVVTADAIEEVREAYQRSEY